MGATADELAWLAEQPVFTVDGAPYSWGDVLLSAELSGALEELTEATRRGLSAAGPRLESDAIRAAAAQFRYDRNLLSAEELQAWLTRWQLELDDWMEHLRRMLLREQRAGPLAPADGQRTLAAAAARSGVPAKTLADECMPALRELLAAGLLVEAPTPRVEPRGRAR